MRTGLRRAGRVAALMLPFALAACQTLIKPPSSCDGDGCASVPPHHEPKVASKPTMHALACDLDHLEKHIDWYGSVVAKAPDVWGQARLTRYREEFDMLMDPITEPDNRFHVGLQGSLARSDQAFFAHATALALAAQPKPPVIGGLTSQKLVPQGRELTVVTNANEKTPDGLTNTKQTTDKTTEALAKPETPAAGPITLTGAKDPKDLLTDPDHAITRDTLLKDRGIGFATLKADGIGLEPSLYIAQKKRHIDFLNQIRRENEGADTADGPGYSINVVRVPVSVVPGKRTDTGHGAEITMTLTPVLGDDLLPVTFRNLVANDLLHQLGFPLTQVLNERKTADKTFRPEIKEGIIALPTLNALNSLISLYKGLPAQPEAPRINARQKIYEFLNELSKESEDRLVLLAQGLGDQQRDSLLALLRDAKAEKEKAAAAVATNQSSTKWTADRAKKDYGALTAYADLSTSPQPNAAIERFTVKLSIPTTYTPGLTNKTGFPASQLIDVYGLSDCFQIAFATDVALRESIVRQGYAHLPDIQGFLQQEIAAAYRFLAEPECHDLWKQFCTRDMVSAVRTRKVDILQEYRTQYRARLKTITRSGANSFNELGEYSTTAALAWCILVDSALLNDRLVQDMREAASAKKQTAPSADLWPEYYLPEPPADARCAFNAYVAMRWPIRVFALDPYSQDQNVADQFSSRREMQLALSIAFTNGYIGANTLTKYTRRLEADYETIALNRTQVGFSHGENIFGWRFYPRFQTPDTESNLTVFARDLVLGGPNRNALLRQRRLEPGPRECVAVVMMPSFVPYATLDTTSNWFGLANPKHKVFDHTQALKLSHTVSVIKNGGCGVKDANCYRDGELDRLMRRAEQLEARLPAQTLSVPVPVINTLGGFEMFNNGVTDLAPELYGWYGAPGISLDDDETSLFLVGDHFSPLNTKVIVGNRAVANTSTTAAAGVYNQKMLSRQVVQVKVSRGTLTVPVVKDGRAYVAAHVATPYGVSRELLIPVVSTKSVAVPPKPGFSVGDSKVTVQYAARPSGKKDQVDEKVEKKDSGGAKGFVAVGVSKKLSLKWVWTDPTISTAAELLVKLEFADLPKADGGKVSLSLPCKCELKATAAATSATEADVVIKEDQLQRLAVDLVRELTAANVPESVWAAGLKSTKVIVTPVAPPGQTARGIVANDQLVIEFKQVEHCDNELKPSECPKLAMPEPKHPGMP